MNQKIIKFRANGEQRKAELISKDLCVTYDDKTYPNIYLRRGGKWVLLYEFCFQKFLVARRFANWLDSIYGKYWGILETYPQADVVYWTRWTVTDGEKIHQFLTMLCQANEPITQKDLGVIWRFLQ